MLACLLGWCAGDALHAGVVGGCDRPAEPGDQLLAEFDPLRCGPVASAVLIVSSAIAATGIDVRDGQGVVVEQQEPERLEADELARQLLGDRGSPNPCCDEGHVDAMGEQRGQGGTEAAARATNTSRGSTVADR